MKLYVYDHCPFCIKARMIFGLKKIPIDIIYVANDDAITPIRMIGKKMVPILEKDDGIFMPESLDIIDYIDNNFGEKIIIGKNSDDISLWIEETYNLVRVLLYPRFILYPFAEFNTQSAKDYFQNKKENGNFIFKEKLKNTKKYIDEIQIFLDELDALIKNSKAVNGELSIDDFHLFAILRNLTIVKNIKFPKKVLDYVLSFSKMTNIPLLFDNAIE